MPKCEEGNAMEEKVLRIYTLDTEELSDEKYYRQCYGNLSAFRQRKIDSYRFQADKKLSMGAGLLLDRGLAAYGLREAEVRTAQKENGKPYLPDYPKIHYNLSHSGNMVLAVFAGTETGCDIELVQAANLKLAQRFFCPREYAYIAGLKEELQDYAFCRLWTLKESFLKVTGMGMKLPLDSFEFELSETAQGINFHQDYDRHQYQFSEYDFGRYHAAVCVQMK